jgi:hypothetical protein
MGSLPAAIAVNADGAVCASRSRLLSILRFEADEETKSAQENERAGPFLSMDAHFQRESRS